MVIYTKTGDSGQTGIYKAVSSRKKRISKDSIKVEVLGSIDELNSFLGVVVSFSNLAEVSSYLKDIQRNLLKIGSIIAGGKLIFLAVETGKLEKIIDKYEESLPDLSNFILPGGTVLASHLQYARSITRLVERCMVSFSRIEKVNANILTYLNRLSDFLFILARFVNYEAGLKEEIWSQKGKRK